LIDLYRAAVPASIWMEVSSVRVADTVQGDSPTLEVDREIKRSFSAHWVAEVHKQQIDGSFATVCTGNGRNEYTPKDSLPTNLDLDWWTFPERCMLNVGTYRVLTVWQVSPSNYPTKRVENMSNMFEVRPS
jgi:hypothetical protein